MFPSFYFNIMLNTRIDLGHVVLIALILVIGYALKNSTKTLKEYKGIAEVSQDSLETYRKANGLLASRISVYESMDPDDFVEATVLDSVTKRLQEVVKENKKLLSEGSATVFETITIFDTVFIPVGVSPDSLTLSDTVTDRWIDVKYGYKFKEAFVGELEHTFFNLKITNSYDVVIGRESTGFLGLGKKKTIVDVTNHNPYTLTSTLRAFKVTDKQDKFIIGPQFGFGLGENLTIKPQLGFGITYNMWSF